MFRPIRSAGDAALRPLSNGWKGAFNYGDVKKERDQLKAKLAEAKSQETRIHQLEVRNKELEKLNGFSAKGVPTRAAQVISDPLSNFDHTLEIDVGSSDGIKVGMVVITGGVDGAAAGGQVLGRITDTASHTSTVELITEPSFAVGVTLKNGDRGTAQGTGAGKTLTVDGISKDTHVHKGDTVETSGLDRSAFPKELVVGTVTRVRLSDTGDSKVLDVKPTADLSSVLVKVVEKVAAG
jgi:rod shape-determining protein MreC